MYQIKYKLKKYIRCINNTNYITEDLTCEILWEIQAETGNCFFQSLMTQQGAKINSDCFKTTQNLFLNEYPY